MGEVVIKVRIPEELGLEDREYEIEMLIKEYLKKKREKVWKKYFGVYNSTKVNIKKEEVWM